MMSTDRQRNADCIKAASLQLQDRLDFLYHLVRDIKNQGKWRSGTRIRVQKRRGTFHLKKQKSRRKGYLGHEEECVSFMQSEEAIRYAVENFLKIRE